MDQPVLALPPTPDFNVYSVPQRLSRVEIERDVLRVTWSDGHVGRYHFLWLRDNCPGPDTHHHETRESCIDVADLPASIRPLSAAIDVAGALAITWSHGGHRSRYHPGWLRHHCYSDIARAMRPERAGKTWDAASLPSPPSVDGPSVLADDDALYEWLIAFRTYGLARLCRLPIEDGMVEQVAKRIGLIRASNFGFTYDVETKPDPDSNAYTALALPPHTDLATRATQPGVQMLMCLVNETGGGNSIMVDGFRLAEVLRHEAAGDYETLTRVPWTFTNRAKDTDYCWRGPVIVTDGDGRVREIRSTMFLRGPLDVAFDDVPRAYRALQHFCRLARDDRLQMEFPLRPGELIAFDNCRILHARRGFDPSRGHRRLQGCYLDGEEIDSRLRVLEREIRQAGLQDDK